MALSMDALISPNVMVTETETVDRINHLVQESVHNAGLKQESEMENMVHSMAV